LMKFSSDIFFLNSSEHLDCLPYSSLTILCLGAILELI
jgi:hypothetical protein